jgi:hypothetical protein
LVARYVADIRHALSAARFAPYRAASASDFDAVLNYHWNVGLSEALYPALAAFEIALRNTIHATLTQRQNGDEFWFRYVLEPRQLREYAAAHAKLIDDGMANPPAGKVVAELKFWFWTSILSGMYHQTLWNPHRAALLHIAFPHLPRVPNNRHFVFERCNDVRQLRNRIMHHEPVWQGMRFQRRGGPAQHLSIDQLHARVIEAIGWISPTLRTSVEQLDRFSAVLDPAWKARLESDIRTALQLP